LEQPDIVIATPSRASQWISSDALKSGDLLHVVIDEADLVLSYGYEDDLKSIAATLPNGVQTILMSATLRTEVDSLTSLFCKSGAPEILDLSEQEATEKQQLSQYIVKTAEQDKFLLTYAIFKLQLIKGKVIVFVADIDRCYRLKLFLEQFGIRSCVLNSELPVNSRLHTVDEFNSGVYDIIIAADEHEVVGGQEKKRKSKNVEKSEEAEENDEETKARSDQDDDNGAEDQSNSKQPPSKKQKQARGGDREFGVARGIDFRHVSCVLNFDLPQSAKSYTHRTGRTARAGQKGMALSFYVPKNLYKKHKSTSISQAEHDEKVLERIKARQTKFGASIDEWQFDTAKLEGFRYRIADAIRSVTRIAVREARTKELRQELINSTKLQRHFEEHPEDLRHLRHDTESHAIRQQPHLKHVPDYLLPSGGTVSIKKDVGHVGIRKDSANRIRKAREINKKRGKGRIMAGKGADPLKSLNARGRAKK
jgi:ATP-dependent RNA helicase DDX56/DBP9